jgi:hypothetical protein
MLSGLTNKVKDALIRRGHMLSFFGGAAGTRTGKLRSNEGRVKPISSQMPLASAAPPKPKTPPTKAGGV